MTIILLALFIINTLITIKGQSLGVCENITNCVFTNGECWCISPSGQQSYTTCRYSTGYNGTYYSIAEHGQTRAKQIIYMLGKTPSPIHCMDTSDCADDCATNTCMNDECWGTSLTCWTDIDRWARSKSGIVRCVHYELDSSEVVTEESTNTSKQDMWNSCTWHGTNGNTDREIKIGYANTPDECITKVKEECPKATIANIDSSGSGECWCQYGASIIDEPSDDWNSCLLSPDTSVTEELTNTSRKACIDDPLGYVSNSGTHCEDVKREGYCLTEVSKFIAEIDEPVFANDTRLCPKACGSCVEGLGVCENITGCVLTNDECWCVSPSGQQSYTACGYSNGYNGTYYSIAEHGQTRAKQIIYILGKTPSTIHCVNTSDCAHDCATNTCMDDECWGTSLTCWTDIDRWARNKSGIVRCVHYEPDSTEVVTEESTNTPPDTSITLGKKSCTSMEMIVVEYTCIPFMPHNDEPGMVCAHDGTDLESYCTYAKTDSHNYGACAHCPLYNECTTHSHCDGNHFCGVECWTGGCGSDNSVAKYSIGHYCQPCDECHINSDSITDDCSICRNDYTNQIPEYGCLDVPDSVTVECDEVPMNVNVINNCGIDIDIVFSEIIVPGICEGDYLLMRSWTDSSSNILLATQNITVFDTSAPEIVSTSPPIAVDNCAQNVSVVLTSEEKWTPGESTHYIIQKLIASDGCVNKEVVIQTVEVHDDATELPTVTSTSSSPTPSYVEIVSMELKMEIEKELSEDEKIRLANVFKKAFEKSLKNDGKAFDGNVKITVEQIQKWRRRRLLQKWETIIKVEITSKIIKTESNLFEKISALTDSLSNDEESSRFLQVINDEARNATIDHISTIVVEVSPALTVVEVSISGSKGTTPAGSPTIDPSTSPTMSSIPTIAPSETLFEEDDAMHMFSSTNLIFVLSLFSVILI